MEAFTAAGGGFLLAVLWFDLMHDVQVREHDRDAPLPEPVLASIAGYYARVTTGARPMNRLIGVFMLLTLGALAAEVWRGLEPTWLPWASLVAAAVPIIAAARRTFPNAVRLGSRRDDADGQSRLARAIFHDHVFCLASIGALLVLQLGSAAR